MFFGRLFLLAFFTACFYQAQADICDSKKEIVCYYGSWAIYRGTEGQFTSENIDPKLCTNIIYTFAGLTDDLEIHSLDTNVDITRGGFANLTKIKKENPCLKVSLALGGWNEGSVKYSKVSSTEESRNKLAENALKFITSIGFDGIDVDWEYPTDRGGTPEDKENFALLLKAIKDKFKPLGLRLSIAVGMNEKFYDIKNIANNVDFVHVMGYDIVTSDSNVTGLQAPLSYVNNKINIWLKQGFPASKLVLGMPTYARCFNLADNSKHGIGAPVKDAACKGKWTDENGVLAFYELQEKIKKGQCQGTQIVDHTVYSWCSGLWMSYDNEKTVAAKTQYVIDKKLGGVMIWSMDNDDFRGLYGKKHTLLNSIHKTINKK